MMFELSLNKMDAISAELETVQQMKLEEDYRKFSYYGFTEKQVKNISFNYNFDERKKNVTLNWIEANKWKDDYFPDPTHAGGNFYKMMLSSNQQLRAAQHARRVKNEQEGVFNNKSMNPDDYTQRSEMTPFRDQGEP